MEYTSQSFKFNFKTRTVKDEEGQVILTINKKPSVEASLPVLSSAGVVEALANGGKEAELIMSAISDIFYQGARAQFDDIIEGLQSPDDEVTASMLDFDKLSLTYLANLPKSARGASAISEEDWNNFFEDYLNVMVAATGKEEKRINAQIAHFKKPTRIKSNSRVLEVLINQLSIYTAKAPNLEDNAACAERLLSKFSKWEADVAAATDPDAL